MIALAEPGKALHPGKRGVALAVGIASLALPVAWAAHTLLGLRLEPGHWTGWAGGLFAWVWVLSLAPILEEVAMRPLLQAGLRHQFDRIDTEGLNSTVDWRGHLANLVTALAFALLHLPANGVLALWWVVPALAIGEVWRRSASCRLCVLLHAWFNASLAAVTTFSSLT